MTAVVLRGDARRLPLPDGSVDLVVTSPPYWGLRDYGYLGQIGSEATPQEWLASLVECTAEWVRVLKPSGSIFVNLGDKFSGAGRGNNDSDRLTNPPEMRAARLQGSNKRQHLGLETAPAKSLLGLPWRYALACVDELGLILRRDIVWSKPNGLPESVTDRCRSSHEYVFHLVRQPRYYAAVDEIREPQAYPNGTHVAGSSSSRKRREAGYRSNDYNLDAPNPLGKLPGSVWSIPSQPLIVPAHLGIDHFAAFPLELPRRCILGWSPPGVCTACGEGRRPVALTWLGRKERDTPPYGAGNHGTGGSTLGSRGPGATITGYACACTPYTDHDGTEGRSRDGQAYARETGRDAHPHGGVGMLPRTGPWREYHFDHWTPPPTTPAIVLDPFAGTGTTLLAASALGRVGIGVDLSADYCRLARWRTRDRAEIAKAMQVPKPPPVIDGQDTLFAL